MAVQDKTKAFKAYDIRGTLGETLDAQMVLEIGRAIVDVTGARMVAVGADARPSSPELKAALIQGLTSQGADVVDIGAAGTEQIYVAAQHLEVDFGVEITASHNPIGDNGMKFIYQGGRPVTSETLGQIRDYVVVGEYKTPERAGKVSAINIMIPYIDHLLSYIDPKVLGELSIVANPGNGMAGPVMDALEERLEADGIQSPFIKMHWDPNPNFPHGIPNPLLVENRPPTIEKVRETKAHLGIAWDGDFDRCFFFDEFGNFIEGYYIVGLLSESILPKNPGGKVVHDPRLIWNTQACAKREGGEAVQSKTGHAFIKAKMREVDAVYGGEMSAHHYFREFGYCDSGMIPWLLVAELMVKSGKSLSELVGQAMREFPCSGEVNFKVNNSADVIEKIKNSFADENPEIDNMDGISMDFGNWRMNIRSSNTEPLLRLNIEARGDEAIVGTMLGRVRALIEAEA